MNTTIKKAQTHSIINTEIINTEIPSQEFPDEILETIAGGAVNPGITEELYGSYNFLLPHIEQNNVYVVAKK